MNNWIYQGKEIQSEEDIPVDNAIGFVYLITQKSTGKRYIGRKLLTKSSSKTINGKKKKVRVQSDWLKYWSSSPQIKEWIKEANGPDDFTREILCFVSSKSELLYAEEYALYTSNALLSDEFLNENIRSRVMKKWFKNKPNFIYTIKEISNVL